LFDSSETLEKEKEEEEQRLNITIAKIKIFFLFSLKRLSNFLYEYVLFSVSIDITRTGACKKKNCNDSVW